MFLRLGRGFALLLLLASVGRATAAPQELLAITNDWKYWQSNSLDGVNWRVAAYDDSHWPSGGGLFYAETAELPAPKTTPLELGATTYYFRTQFEYDGTGAPHVGLLFSSLIDDGAVFYLNGVEIQRVGMGGGQVQYATLAQRPVGDATVFDTFFVSGPALALLVTGNNVLAVEVHQLGPASSDVVFGCQLSLVTGLPPALVRGPYLQNGSQTNITIRWRTAAPTGSSVRYGTNVASLDLLAVNPADTTEHEIKLTQLRPDTRYYYSIGNLVGTLAGGDPHHFFRTAPVSGTPKPTRIWAFGDSGSGWLQQITVRDAYAAFAGARPADVWLLLGDNAYTWGMDFEYQANFFGVYTNQLRNTVVWSALGNHDTANSPDFVDTYPYFDIFTFPTQGEAGGVPSGTEHYYSFDHGNIHFISLDTMTGGRSVLSPMYQWLTNDLTHTTADWVIAFFHHPPYSRGSHLSDVDIESIQTREVIVPALEKGGVDLVLTGHSHNYERSYLLNGHYGYSSSLTSNMKLNAGTGRPDETGPYLKPAGGPIPNQGTVYAIAGSAGRVDMVGDLTHPAHCVSLYELGSLVLDVHSNRLDAIFLRDNGTTNDIFTILKVNYPPVASNQIVVVPANAASVLNLTGSDINRDPISFSLVSLPAHGLIVGLAGATGQLEYEPAHGYHGPDSFSFRVLDGLTNSSSATVNLNIQPPPDANANGVPDDWEAAYGIASLSDDNDGDGLSNAQEYWANTNPTNAVSALQILDASMDAQGRCSLTWASVGGTRYRISYRDGDLHGEFADIVSPANVEIDPAPRSTVSTRTFTDDLVLTGGAPTNRARYFRVKVVR